MTPKMQRHVFFDVQSSEMDKDDQMIKGVTRKTRLFGQMS